MVRGAPILVPPRVAGAGGGAQLDGRPEGRRRRLVAALEPPPGVGVSACPYLFVFPGTRCETTTWMGRRLPPEPHPDQRRFEQSVKSIVGESLQTVHEALKEVRATPVLQGDTGGDVESVRVMAAAALACACASFLTPFALLCASRASRGKATIVRHPVEAPT